MTDLIKTLIIKRLIRSNTWGGKHLPLLFVLKGLPEHFRNTHQGRKAIDNVLKELVSSE